MKLIPVSFDPFAKAKVPKASVSYSHGMPSSHCGICQFYANRSCSKVGGEIDPAYWCRLFVRKRKGFAEGGAPEMTAPFPEAPGGYPFFTADSASDTPSGVLPSDLPPVDVPPAERGPIAGFVDKAVDWWQNQPSWLEQAQQQSQRDIEAYNQSGVKGMMADTGTTQDLAGGFGGTTIGTAGKIAKAAMPVANDMGFYSAVEHAVNSAPQAKASPQQWLGTIKNTLGVKPEEMEWTGLSDWLSQQKGHVSKEQVADFVKANNIEIKEVTKGGEPDLREQRISEIDAQIRELSNWPDENTVAQDPTKQPQLDTLLKEWDSINDDATPSPSPTKFSSYTLPGGQNYREMLLTLPPKPVDMPPPPELLTELPKGPDWENSYRVLHYGGDGPERAYGVIPPGQSHARAMAGQHPTEEEAIRQALNHINATEAQQYNQKIHEAQKEGQFRTSHWDEPNVLAHIRFNDRTIDGKKTLFVEEVQSDWHQKGKREGYAQEPDTSGWKATPSNTEPPPQDNRVRGGWWNVYDQNGNRIGTSPRHSANTPEDAIADVAGREKFKGVPDAPFKTTWPELSMKRVLKYAADNGYEKLAWTPGDVQAARYDLSKHVDRIGYTDRGDGTYNISASRGDLGIFEEDRVDAKRLQELVGKDMAEKITKGEGRTYDTYQNHVTRELTGLDLKVGGEGMKGFYDQILPATVNKLVKKYGAKVERSNIEDGKHKLQKVGRNWSILNPHGEPVDQFVTRDAAEIAANRMDREHIGANVHAVDINPQMKKAISEQGFPQFSTGGSVKPRLTPIAHDPWEAHSATRRAMHGHKHT